MKRKKGGREVGKKERRKIGSKKVRNKEEVEKVEGRKGI